MLRIFTRLSVQQFLGELFHEFLGGFFVLFWVFLISHAEICKGQEHGRPAAADYSASAGVYRTLHNCGDPRGGKSLVTHLTYASA